MDKIDLIYDIVKDTKARVEDLSEKTSAIERLTDVNTHSLLEHMKRSAANEKRIQIIENRFTVRWVAKHVYTSVIGISVFVGALAKLLGYI